MKIKCIFWKSEREKEIKTTVTLRNKLFKLTAFNMILLVNVYVSVMFRLAQQNDFKALSSESP